VARALSDTDAYRQSRKHRKKVEMLFAHLKRILKLDATATARTNRCAGRIPARRHRAKLATHGKVARPEGTK
jgi:hypothetical protein